MTTYWRSLLVHAPTLILHRRDVHFIPLQHARYLAEHLPDAKLVELRGADLSLMWEAREQALDLIEEFLTGVRRVPPPRQVLATVLLTDIVGSTERAGWLRRRAGGWSRRLAMGSWPPSTVPAGASAVRPR
jgi:hypothetical protein